MVNPHQVRAFARAIGELAKTDGLDARLLALFAERIRPGVRPLADEALEVHEALDAFLTRRRQLLEMLQAERDRQGQVCGRGTKVVKQRFKAHIAYLDRELRMTVSELGRAVGESPI